MAGQLARGSREATAGKEFLRSCDSHEGLLLVWFVKLSDTLTKFVKFRQNLERERDNLRARLADVEAALGCGPGASAAMKKGEGSIVKKNGTKSTAARKKISEAQRRRYRTH